MKRVKLDLAGKSELEILALANAHQQGLAAHAATFPTPDPAAVDVAAHIAAAEAARTAVALARQALEAANLSLEEKMQVVADDLNLRAQYVEKIARTVSTAIFDAGFEEAIVNNTPLGLPDQPQNFRCSHGALPGTIQLRCAPVKGAKSYIWECRKHADGEPWVQVKVSTAASFLVTGLTAGVEYAFRVRAVGAAGDGPWSDEAVLRAL